MQDGITTRNNPSFTESYGNGNISNGGSTIELYQQQQCQHRRSTPSASVSSSPVKKSPSSSPSHIFSNGAGSLSGGSCNGEFKLCGYDGNGEDCSSSGTSPAEIFGMLGFWLKLRHDFKSVPWKQFKQLKMKNPRAAPGCAYIPTKVSDFG